MDVRMRSVEPALNRFRFYEISAEPSLLGDWHIVRAWGRLGVWRKALRRPTTQAQAYTLAARIVQLKTRRGYALCSASDWDVDAHASRIRHATALVARRALVSVSPKVDLTIAAKAGYPCADGDIFWRRPAPPAAEPAAGDTAKIFAFPGSNIATPAVSLEIRNMFLGELLFDDDELLDLGRNLFWRGISTVGEFLGATDDQLLFAVGSADRLDKLRKFVLGSAQ